MPSAIGLKRQLSGSGTFWGRQGGAVGGGVWRVWEEYNGRAGLGKGRLRKTRKGRKRVKGENE